MSTLAIARTLAGSGKYRYAMTGTINGTTYDDESVYAASSVLYTHASLTTLTDGNQVLGFHKTQAAAARGNAQIARKYHARVQVIEIA